MLDVGESHRKSASYVQFWWYVPGKDAAAVAESGCCNAVQQCILIQIGVHFYLLEKPSCHE